MPDTALNVTADDIADTPTVPEPVYFNDALVLGDFPQEMATLLDQEATILLGEFYEDRDRRNTQDGKWLPVTTTWNNLIAGAPETKHGPEWGFSRHPVAKAKEGPCFVLGSSVAGARVKTSMVTMAALGLDVDSGTPLDETIRKIRELNLMCLVYTSYNFGKTSLELKRDEVMKKLGIKSDPTLDQVKEYLRNHNKNRYAEAFIDTVAIKEAKKQIKGGVVIQLTTPPQDKFRLVFPFLEGVTIVDTAATHAEALSLWEDKVTGFAVSVLGVHFDTSCTDPSRIFFGGRHAKDAEWECLVIAGKPLDYAGIPVYKKSLYTSGREVLSPFEQVGDDNSDRPAEVFAPSGLSLTKWHSEFKKRFQVAAMLETRCGDKIRVAGGEATGHVHFECPFEDSHTEPGTGTATLAIDALDARNELWNILCQHSSCQGRHKTEFLAKIFESGWVGEEVLHPDAGFILDDEDQPDDEEQVLEEPGNNKKRGQSSKTTLSAHPSFDISAPLGTCLKSSWMTLEKRFAYVNHGGQPIFFRRVDPTATVVDRVVETFTHKALIDWHEDRKVPTKGESDLNPALTFLEKAKRYSGVTFAPEPRTCPPNVYNLWSGFAVERQANKDADKAEVIRKFIEEVICADRKDVYDWVYNWLAHTIQRPGDKPGTALVIQGEGGCGKSTFGEMLHHMCAPFSVYASDPDHVTGKFNAHKATAVMLISDEALFGGDPKIAGIIKQQVTGKTERIEPKGIDSFEVPSSSRYVYIGNPKRVVPIELNGSDRRYMCLTISNKYHKKTEYFAALDDAIKNGGLAAFMEQLRAYNPAHAGLTWADVREAPLTPERQMMRLQSLKPAQKAVLEMVQAGELVARDLSNRLVRYVLSETEEIPIEKGTLANSVDKLSNKNDPRSDLDNVLEELFGKGMITQKRVTASFNTFGADGELNGTGGKLDVETKAKARCYVFPPLPVLRAKMKEVFALMDEDGEAAA